MGIATGGGKSRICFKLRTCVEAAAAMTPGDALDFVFSHGTLEGKFT